MILKVLFCVSSLLCCGVSLMAQLDSTENTSIQLERMRLDIDEEEEELQQFESLVERFQRAVTQKDIVVARSLQTELITTMEQEIGDSKAYLRLLQKKAAKSEETYLEEKAEEDPEEDSLRREKKQANRDQHAVEEQERIISVQQEALKTTRDLRYTRSNALVRANNYYRILQEFAQHMQSMLQDKKQMLRIAEHRARR